MLLYSRSPRNFNPSQLHWLMATLHTSTFSCLMVALDQHREIKGWLFPEAVSISPAWRQRCVEEGKNLFLFSLFRVFFSFSHVCFLNIFFEIFFPSSSKILLCLFSVFYLKIFFLNVASSVSLKNAIEVHYENYSSVVILTLNKCYLTLYV